MYALQLLSTMALCALILPTTTDAAFDKYRALCLVNRERRRRGLPNLGLDERLCDAAKEHSKYQASRRRMSHNGYRGSDPSQRIEDAGYRWLDVAENIAYGYRSDDEVMYFWMGSSGHKKNILDKRATHFGYGVAHARNGQAYFTQDFAGDGRRHDYPTCPGRGDYD